MKNKFYTLLFLSFSVLSYSNAQTTDGLSNLMRNTNDLALKFELLLKITQIKIPYGGEEEAKQAILIAQQLSDQAKLADAHYFLGKYYYTINEGNLAEENIKKALDFYKSINGKKGQIESLNLLGDNEYFRSNYPKALNYITEAEKIAQALNNKVLIGETKFFLSRIYFVGLREHEKALSILKESELLLKTDPSTPRLIDVYFAFCTYYQELKNVQGLLKYIEKLETNISLLSLEEKIYYNSVVDEFKGHFHWLKGDLNKGEEYFLAALANYIKIGDAYVIADIQLYLSELALDQKDWPKAILYAKEGLKYDDWEYKMDSYEMIKKAFKAVNQDSFIFYDEKFVAARDSFDQIGKLTELNQVLRNNEISQKEIEIKQQKTSKLFIILLSIFAAFLLIIGLLKFYKRTQKQKVQLAIIENEKSYIKSIFEGKETELSNLQKKVSTIERSLMSSQLNFERQQSTLSNVTQFLKKLVTNEKPENLKKQLRSLSRSLESNLSKEDHWELFAKQFEQIHPQFFALLIKQFPGLNSRDLRLCAYVRLGMDNQEIADIFGIEASSVIKARHRMKKKMGLEKAQDLNQFLLHL